MDVNYDQGWLEAHIAWNCQVVILCLSVRVAGRGPQRRERQIAMRHTVILYEHNEETVLQAGIK